MSTVSLYHVGYDEIRKPDVHYGRKNADFGQGFYLSPNKDFSVRWARQRKGQNTFLNSYELDTDGLKIKTLDRNVEWYEYIFRNRNGFEDNCPDCDVIIGPIANDTIYDTLGIITSGFLSEKNSLRLLMVGPAYIQVALKTEKASDQLKWLSTEVLDPAEIEKYRNIVVEEEKEYQALFAEEFAKLEL